LSTLKIVNSKSVHVIIYMFFRLLYFTKNHRPPPLAVNSLQSPFGSEINIPFFREFFSDFFNFKNIFKFFENKTRKSMKKCEKTRKYYGRKIEYLSTIKILNSKSVTQKTLYFLHVANCKKRWTSLCRLT